MSKNTIKNTLCKIKSLGSSCWQRLQGMGAVVWKALKTFFTKKRCKKVLKLLVHIVEVVTGIFIILTGILLFRLSQGPLEIQALTPIIQKALHVKDMGLSLDIKTVYLQLGLKKGQLVDIAISDMRVFQADNSDVLSVPEASISFQVLPLFKGEVLPSVLSLSEPVLNVSLTSSESNTAEQAAPKDYKTLINDAADKAKTLLGRLRYTEHLAMQDGTMYVQFDNQNVLSLTQVQMDIMHLRGPRIGLHTTFHLHHQEQELPLEMRAQYNQRTHQLSAELNFQDINPALLLPQDELLKGIQTVLKGTIKGEIDLDKQVSSPRQFVSELSFDIETTQEGSLYLPAPIATTYPLKQVNAHGKFEPALTALSVYDTTLSLGKPSADVSVDITGLDKLLDTGDISAVQTVLNATVKNVPMEQVPEVWPATIGTDVHTWVKENMSKGGVTTADFKLDFAGADITKIYGAVRLEGVQVRYLDGMSPIDDVKGIVYLAQDKVDIDIQTGHTGEVYVTKADLHFLDLEEPISRTEMSLDLEGPLQKMLKIADEDPLALVRDLDVDTDTVQGQAKTNISLAFPFLDDLSFKDIKVHIVGDITQGYFPIAELSTDFTNGMFHVDITEKRLKMSGTAQMEKMPISVSWEENFQPNKKDFQIRYILKGEIGVPILSLWYADAPSVLDGTVMVDVQIDQSFDNVIQMKLSADLTNAALILFPINYVKNQGTKGTISAQLQVADEVLLKQFQMIVPDDKVKIEGTAHFGQATHVEFPVIQAPNNDLSFVFDQAGKASKIQAKGKSLDLTQVLHSPFDSASSSDSSPVAFLNNLSVAMDLDKLYFSEKPLHKVHLVLDTQNGRFKAAEGRALAADPIEITLNKDTLYLTNDDLGDLLTRLDYTQRIHKGLLRLQVKPMKEGGFEGTVFAKEYELTETSFLMQALTILGLVDAIRGKDLAFDEGTFPFTWTPDGVLTITDGVTYGTSVGITLNGTLQDGTAALKGSVIPAYIINSLPGKVPLVGWIFSGDKGGGLVGVAFEITGKLSEPEMSFAPSSLLTPGIFRNLLN